jgi:hypothetical protein
VFLNVAMPKAPAMARQSIEGGEVEIAYPRRRFLGTQHGWLVYFSGVCVLSSMVIGRWMRVPL